MKIVELKGYLGRWTYDIIFIVNNTISSNFPIHILEIVHVQVDVGTDNLCIGDSAVSFGCEVEPIIVIHQIKIFELRRSCKCYHCFVLILHFPNRNKHQINSASIVALRS